MNTNHSTRKYWTIQSLEAWEAARQSGFLHGHSEYITYRKPYHWMMSQMGQRLPGYDGSYPVWVWLDKPDLLEMNHFTGRNQCVCLTLQLDQQDVLLSDFDEWHAVLNNSFNAVNQEEWQQYRAGKQSITKEQSWQRIFDINRNHSSAHPLQNRRLQGVTGAVSLEQIIRVEYMKETFTRKNYYYV